MLPFQSFNLSAETQTIPAGVPLLRRSVRLDEVLHVDSGRVALGLMDGGTLAHQIAQRGHPRCRRADGVEDEHASGRRPGQPAALAGRDPALERRQVEARQAVQCPEPEITIKRLRERHDGTLRQAIVRIPDLHDERRFRRRALSKKQPGGKTDEDNME